MNRPSQISLIVALLLCACSILSAQKIQPPPVSNADWARPYAPFRIAGNLYYVGTYDLACYLIATPQGNILINTGLAGSDTMIKYNIEKLGFKYSDTKILLTTQAHYDHLGAMAAIKKSTNAILMVNEKDAAVVADGGNSDYAFGGKGSFFESVKPDRLLKNGDTVAIGNIQLVMLHHPGHTKGSCSYLFTVKDEKQSYRVLIANMPTIIVDKPFKDVSAYPSIAEDYAYTFKAMKKISFDIWLASHASQFNMHDKHKPGDKYNPDAFKDKKRYDDELGGLEKQYKKKRLLDKN